MDEEDIEFYFSLIVKKFYLGKDENMKDLFIYKPVEIVYGILDDDEVFINDNGREYKSIVDLSFGEKSDEDEGYFLCVSESQAEEAFGTSDPEEIYNYYENVLSNGVLIGVEGDNNNCYISIVDKELIKHINSQSIGFSGDDAIIPMKDLEEVLKSDDLDTIKAYFNNLSSIKEEVDKQIEEALNAEDDEELSEDEKDGLKKEKALSEEEKQKLAEEMIRDAKEHELEEIFAGQEDIYSPEYKRKKIKELYKKLHEIVVGQDDAIDTVCYTIYKNTKLKDGEKKTNCILVGPTGSGKSLILEVLAKEYDMPVVHVDSNSLSTTGYVGDNVEDCLSQLMTKADGDKVKAEHGIVVFDEVDKKGTSDNGDVGGKGVINQLLRFVEGQEYNVDYIVNNRKRHCVFNTTNLTVFACGAFPEIYEELLKKNSKGNGIGFMSKVRTEEEKKAEEKKQLENLNISQEDIGTIGKMGPEFAGRFIVAPLHKLTKDDLVNIMTTSKESPLVRESQLLSEDDVEFYNDSQFVEKIAEDAYKSGTGGRGVRNTIEAIFKTINKKVIFEDSVTRSEDGKIYLYGTVDEEGKVCILTGDGSINLLNNKKYNPETMSSNESDIDYHNEKNSKQTKSSQNKTQSKDITEDEKVTDSYDLSVTGKLKSLDAKENNINSPQDIARKIKVLKLKN